MNMQSFNTMILWSTTCWSSDSEVCSSSCCCCCGFELIQDLFQKRGANISKRGKKIMFGMIYHTISTVFAVLCNLFISCMHGIPEWPATFIQMYEQCTIQWSEMLVGSASLHFRKLLYTSIQMCRVRKTVKTYWNSK